MTVQKTGKNPLARALEPKEGSGVNKLLISLQQKGATRGD